MSEASGIARVTGRYPMTATAADFDGDGWLDIYAACDSTASILYRNGGDGTFKDVAVESGVAYSEMGNVQAGMGLALGDYDSDGRLDLLKTHFADDIPALYRGLGRGQYEDAATAAGLGQQNRYVEWGAGPARPRQRRAAGHRLRHRQRVPGGRAPAAAVSASRPARRVPQSRGAARSRRRLPRAAPAPIEGHSSRGAAFGDVDNDGDVDVLVMNMNEPPSLLRNDYAGPNSWIGVRLEGSRSNRAGLGATVVVTSAAGRARRRPC